MGDVGNDGYQRGPTSGIHCRCGETEWDKLLAPSRRTSLNLAIITPYNLSKLWLLSVPDREASDDLR